jgi:prepilin-type N-terminal cleavage/methylation domain-containing protein
MRSLGRCSRGFTLIEMVVAIGLFSLTLMIASLGFQRVIAGSNKYSKMEQSNISGVVGLEIMRHDLEQVGFGLPWGWVTLNASSDPPLVPSGLNYSEATDPFGSTLNDAPNGVPRAFVGLSQTGALSTAYFSVKGTTAGRSLAGPSNAPGSMASQYWTYILYQNYSASVRQSRPVKFASNNPSLNDRVLVINSSPNTPSIDRMLVVGPGNSNLAATSPPSFYTSFKPDGSTDPNFLPANPNSVYLVYDLLGNGDKTTAGVTIDTPRMPFNRADFFVDNSNVPPRCAPGSGTLYKATVNHGSTGGDYDKIPLLDCVAGMEVVLGWDTSTTVPLTGSVGDYSYLPTTAGGAVSATGSSAAAVQGWLSDPQGLREHLKLIKVYILAQDGPKDTGYTAPATIEVGDQIADGGLSPKNVKTLTTAQRQYRWKLYRIVVRPKNLVSNSN